MYFFSFNLLCRLLLVDLLLCRFPLPHGALALEEAEGAGVQAGGVVALSILTREQMSEKVFLKISVHTSTCTAPLESAYVSEAVSFWPRAATLPPDGTSRDSSSLIFPTTTSSSLSSDEEEEAMPRIRELPRLDTVIVRDRKMRSEAQWRPLRRAEQDMMQNT